MKELIDEIEGLLDERKALKNRLSEKRAEAADRISRNYETLFMTEYKALYGLFLRLHNVTSAMDDSDYVAGKWRVSIVCDRPRVDINGGESPNEVARRVRSGSALEAEWEAVTDFLTPEGTLALLDKFKETFSKCFNKMAEAVREGNAELAAKVDCITRLLEKSSAPVEMEDGTIEIRLNGKTYVGKVKEE